MILNAWRILLKENSVFALYYIGNILNCLPTLQTPGKIHKRRYTELQKTRPAEAVPQVSL